MIYTLTDNNQFSFFETVIEKDKKVNKSNKKRKNKNIKKSQNTQIFLNLDAVDWIEQKTGKENKLKDTKMTNEELGKLLNISSSEQFAEILNNLKLNRFKSLIADLDDNSIIKAIKNEELKYLYKQEAMEYLYGKYEYLYGYAIYKAKLHIRNGDEVEYKNHGHILMSKAISSFDDTKGCSFKSFLYCVLYRGYISKYFQTDKYKFNEVPLIPIVEGDECATFDRLLSDMIEEESYKSLETDSLLTELQESLTDVEYQCVMARVFGLAYKDIAELTGLTIKQVDNKIQRIRKNKIAALY